MKFLVVLPLAFVIAGIVVCKPKCKDQIDREKLIECLKENAKPLVIPTTLDESGKEKPVEVFETFLLTGLHVDKEMRSFVAQLLILLYWRNPRLQWNGPIKSVVLPKRIVWTPQLASFTPGAAMSGAEIDGQSNRPLNLAVYPNGNVSEALKVAYKNWCSISTKNPLMLICEIVHGSWFDDLLTLTLHKAPGWETVQNLMQKDSVWKVTNMTWDITNFTYGGFVYPFSKIVLYVTMNPGTINE